MSANPSSIEFQVLSLGDLEEVYAYAEERMKREIPDETDRRFRLWDVRWKREALEHYLKLGWSFIARIDGRAVGFFLGQPFLFYRGQTQTLWVEHLEADTAQITDALSEVAVKIAREKHFQRVLFGQSGSLRDALERWKPSPLENDIVEIRTTK